MGFEISTYMAWHTAPFDKNLLDSTLLLHSVCPKQLQIKVYHMYTCQVYMLCVHVKCTSCNHSGLDLVYAIGFKCNGFLDSSFTLAYNTRSIILSKLQGLSGINYICTSLTLMYCGIPRNPANALTQFTNNS